MKKFTLSFFLLILLLIEINKPVQSQNVIHFIPFPEQDLYNSFKRITDADAATIGGPLNSVISLVSSEEGTIVYYDHWEDGYESNILSPAQGTTKIYGDGDINNGTATAVGCTGCTGDLIHKGSVLSFSNQVPMPRNPANIFFDGRDKVVSTKYVVISKSSYPQTPGSVLADATEVVDVSGYNHEYRSPIGVDMATGVDNDMFMLCEMYLMASEDGTSVQIDADANGTYETTVSLNQGESYKILSVNVNAHILASKPIEADLFTARTGASYKYENRWFTLYPVNLWSNSYYCPITTMDAQDPASVFLFNPGNSTLTINYTTRTSSGTISVGSKQTVRWNVPTGTGARFYTSSSSDKFFALGAMDTDLSNNQTHDWGMTLLPESYLTTSVVCGWGPGSIPPPAQDGNPVWIIATSATTIYADYDGNPATGASIDINGNHYDVSFNLAAYQVQRVFDNSDKDQTGMRVYTLNGARLAGAWGQDPSTSGCCSPYLDMGTTLSPDRVMLISKLASLSYDPNINGLLDAGDKVQYSIAMENFSIRDRSGVVVKDAPSSYMTYEANSTTRKTTNLSDGTFSTVAIPDDGSGTAFPLDGSGFALGSLSGGYKVEVIYTMVANSGINTQSYVENTATVTSSQSDNFTTKKQVPVNNTFTGCALNFTNSSYVNTSSYTINSTLYFSMTAAYLNVNAGVAETAAVTLTNTTTADEETVTLTETGVNTGIFHGSIASSTSSGGTNHDGTLKAISGDNLSVTYYNAFYNNTCTSTASMAIATNLVKQLYLSDSLTTLGLDRVKPYDGSTASSGVISSGSSTITKVGTEASATSGNVSTYSFSYNSGSTGANRYLMVGISYGDGAITVSSVNYASSSMTLIGSAAASESKGRIYIYGQKNPATGSNTLQVNWSSTLSHSSVIGAVCYAGVNGDYTYSTGFASSAAETGTPTVSVASATGELAFGVVQGILTGTYTVTGGGTSLWSVNAHSAFTSGSGQQKAGASSLSLSWSGTAVKCVCGGVSLKPAGSSGTPVSFTQTPSMCSGLAVTSGGTVTATLYLSSITGTMPASPLVTAVVKYGSTTIANLANASYNSGTGVLTLTGTAVSGITVPAGQSVVIEVTTAQTGVTFKIDYDSQTKPSQVNLPTTSVISVTNVAIYNAPYPGGSLVTSVDNGSIVYVRTVVSDSFGYYDIPTTRSTPVSITGPSSYSLSAVATSVATAGCTRTLEYTWQTPTVEGDYNIQVTAKEGYEDAITDSKSTLLNLKQSDVGTPCSSGFYTSNTYVTPTTTYTANSTLYMQVTDADQDLNPSSPDVISVTVTAVPNGDVETFNLTESGNSTGIFHGSIATSAITGQTHQSGTVYAPEGTTLNFSYTDPTDPGDICNNTAIITHSAPTGDGLVLTKTLTSPANGIANIGESIVFTVKLTNVGTQAITTLTLTDTYSTSCLTFISASITPYSSNPGTIVWNSNIVPIAVGETKTITLTFTAAGSCSPATNDVATSNGLYSGGSSVNNTSASANVTITSPNISISKILVTTLSECTFKVGDAIQFQIVVTNTGNTNITSIPMNDTYSAYCMNFVSATPSPTGTGGGVLYWSNLASSPLTPGNTITVTVNLLVSNGCGVTNNTAEIIGAIDVNGDPLPDVQSSANAATSAFNVWMGNAVGVDGDDWKIPANWSLNEVPSCSPAIDATIPYPSASGRYPVIKDAGMSVANLLIENQASLTINPGMDLTACGCTEIFGTDALYLKSDGTSGNASFVTTQAGTITYKNSGSAKVELFLTKCFVNPNPLLNSCWHYISSPVKNATASVFYNDYMRSFNEVTGGWEDITVTSTPLNVIQGYAWSNLDDDKTKTFHGELNDGTVSYPLTRTLLSPDHMRGWNLVGNPYPSEIDINTLSASNTLTEANFYKVDPTVYYLDQSAGNYVVSPLPPPVPGTGVRYIPSMQGFFVHVWDGGSPFTNTSGTITFNDGNRITTGTELFYKDMIADQVLLKAEGSSGMNDQAVVYFRPDVTTGFDYGFDFQKLNGNKGAPQLYAVSSDDVNLTIDGVPYEGENTVVPLEFFVDSDGAGNYSITANRLESFSYGVKITLEDKKAQTTQELTANPVYNFSYAEGDNPARFLLHFFNPFFWINDQVKENGLLIYSYGHDVYLKDLSGKPEKGEMFIYNMMGQEIIHKPVSANSLNKYTVNLPNGYYIVRVITKEKAYCGKVYLD